jgi:hypothetical protein
MNKKKEVVSRSKLVSPAVSRSTDSESTSDKKPHIIHRIGHHIDRIRHHVYTYHRIRKQKEENLPQWKQKWHDWNEKYFGWLEHLVDVMIPYLVILLLFIILGEFADKINFFGWQFLNDIAKIFAERKPVIDFIDGFIVCFFVIDLYFNFFKKRYFLTFLRTSILDIIAIIPLGFIFRFAELSDVQGIFHIVGGVEKEAIKVIKVVPKVVKLHRLGQFVKKKED